MPDLSHLPLPTLQQLIFLAIAGVTVLGAFIVILAPNLYHNALGLVLAFFGVAGVYVLLEAEFLAVSQILVYVGAISTLITFAIMLTRSMMFGGTSPTNRQMLSVAIITALLFFVLGGLLTNAGWVENMEPLAQDGQTIIATLGTLFVTTYFIPFELMALLLLVALTGALMLARDR